MGCTLHSDKHSQYPIELGIPEELAHLEDHFFEHLPVKEAKTMASSIPLCDPCRR